MIGANEGIDDDDDIDGDIEVDVKVLEGVGGAIKACCTDELELVVTVEIFVELVSGRVIPPDGGGGPVETLELLLITLVKCGDIRGPVPPTPPPLVEVIAPCNPEENELK